MYNSVTAEELKRFLSRSPYKHELGGRKQRRKKKYDNIKEIKKGRKEN